MSIDGALIEHYQSIDRASIEHYQELVYPLETRVHNQACKRIYPDDDEDDDDDDNDDDSRYQGHGCLLETRVRNQACKRIYLKPSPNS
jgi:hypothetical protein